MALMTEEAEGLISQALAAHTTSIVGADVSQGMVDMYNARVADHGIEPGEMRAVVVSPSLDSLANALGEQLFEVAVVRGSLVSLLYLALTVVASAVCLITISTTSMAPRTCSPVSLRQAGHSSSLISAIARTKTRTIRYSRMRTNILSHIGMALLRRASERCSTTRVSSTLHLSPTS
jgi:hypothetical protein